MSAPPPLLPQFRYMYNQGKKPLVRGLFFAHVGFATVLYVYWKIPVTRKLILEDRPFSTSPKFSQKLIFTPRYGNIHMRIIEVKKSPDTDKKWVKKVDV